MISKGTQARLGATVAGPRPGGFPLGSVQSRAAARALLVARRANEEQLRFRVVSVLDGKPVNLDGLAERLRAARMRLDAEEGISPLPAIDGGQATGAGRRTDCLEERMRRARERVAQM